MLASSPYTFRKVTRDDLALLAAWRSSPHVIEWWGPFEPDYEVKLADTRVAGWIVSFNRRPFAFMRDYTVHGWDDHHFAALPEGARGVDQFIGEPDMLGAGHGTRFIGMRMRVLFDEGAPVIATDPHPRNERAIAAYKKLGFEPFGAPQETKWGPILPMLARRKD